MHIPIQWFFIHVPFISHSFPFISTSGFIVQYCSILPPRRKRWCIRWSRILPGRHGRCINGDERSNLRLNDLGFSMNGGTSKWMVMLNTLKNGWFGVPPFWETSICMKVYLSSMTSLCLRCSKMLFCTRVVTWNSCWDMRNGASLCPCGCGDIGSRGYLWGINGLSMDYLWTIKIHYP